MALDLRLSRVRTGVAAMRQDCNYNQLDPTELGRKIKWVQLKSEVYIHLSQIDLLRFSQFLTFNPSKSSLS